MGIWQRDENRWIEIVPWTVSPAVHPGGATNDLTVRTNGNAITVTVNGTQVAQVSTELSQGRVGVFVGGDGNQVVLEHFGVRSGDAAPLGSSQPATLNDLLHQLDGAWASADWPKVFGLLDQIADFPDAPIDIRDKRYAAHMAAGEELLAKGNKSAALGQFAAADSIDPRRGEAKAVLRDLSTGTAATTAKPLRQLPSADTPILEYLRGVVDDVDEFWSIVFAEMGVTYRPEVAHWYHGTSATACGVVVSGVVGPFYCPRDAGIYFDVDFLQALRKDAGDFPVAYAAAHEIGHHIQHLLGNTYVSANAQFGQPYSIEVELQADCLAGAWAQSAYQRGLATPKDIRQAVIVAWAFGDPAGTSAISRSAHGNSDQRAAAFIQGFRGSGGLNVCTRSDSSL